MISKTVPTPVSRSLAIRGTPRLAAKALLMAATLAASLLAVPRLGWRATGAVAGVYALFVALASVMLAMRRSLNLLPVLPPVLASLHVSYGVGFLTGLVALARRVTSLKARQHAGESTGARA